MPRANMLEGVGLVFRETMAGAVQDRPLGFDATIRIAELDRFFEDPVHAAELGGTVTCPALGGDLPMRDGVFQLFAPDAETGMRQMRYAFRFTAAGGQTYYLDGHKDIHDDPGIDAIQDLTRLYTTVYRGENSQAPPWGAGELRFSLTGLPAMLASFRAEGARDWMQEVAARVAFMSFAWGQVRDEYLDQVRLFYDTRYQNLVLSGQARNGERLEPFFLVSGVHDKGFPWGDGELFWDVLLALGDRSWAITDRVLTGLRLNIDEGTCGYTGPLYAPVDSYRLWFSEMKSLPRTQAAISVRFRAKAYDTVDYPFPLVDPVVRKLSSGLQQQLRAVLPGENAPGIHITPHLATVLSGSIELDGERWEIDAAASLGECERSFFRNLKEPTLLYGYLCAPRPETRSARVQIHSRTLRDDRQYWVKDKIDALVGAAVERTSSSEIAIGESACTVKPLKEPLRKTGAPLLEVNNDHFPTAVFQRRIVLLEDGSPALEEDMRTLRLEAIGCDRHARVAALHGDDKLRTLDCVLETTGFDAAVEERLRASGKPRETFSIVIKPNFMFSYDKRDASTYTDPELVAHLVRRLLAQGFRAVRIVEAQSTYGEYFDKRSVKEMAEYLGYAGCEIVDMTMDADEQRDLGPHLGVHPVSRVWRGADFRISFAKNKTHAYSYYTLTLKNIYGALPLANKFREYHCRRDIYHTCIEYLAAFPVHFGLIDAWLSADGPFGVFADPEPNPTCTILGGPDLVAVDWVGASMMGLDPMLSKHMQLAVERFGKPEIELVGDANPYRPWLNVPAVLTEAAHGAMDAEYTFGNLLYSVAAQMDETHFHHTSNQWYVKALRKMTVPLRRTFFLRAGEERSTANRFFGRVFYWLGY